VSAAALVNAGEHWRAGAASVASAIHSRVNSFTYIHNACSEAIGAVCFCCRSKRSSAPQHWRRQCCQRSLPQVFEVEHAHLVDLVNAHHDALDGPGSLEAIPPMTPVPGSSSSLRNRLTNHAPWSTLCVGMHIEDR
jgi:hypothetical protein